MGKTEEARRVRYVRMSEREWVEVEVGAAQHGLRPSTYLREAALRAIRRETTTTCNAEETN